MRRLLESGLALALTIGAARADTAPPPPRMVEIAAGGLNFLVVASVAGVDVALVGCVEGRPNCALAHAKGVIGAKMLKLDGEPPRGGVDAAGQILDAFGRANAPATIAIEFAAGASTAAAITVEFARR